MKQYCLELFWTQSADFGTGKENLRCVCKAQQLVYKISIAQCVFLIETDRLIESYIGNMPS